MAASRIKPEDAQEGLEAVRLVGAGWVRQLALNVRLGHHKALGMTPRQYAASVGQRLVDPVEAIKELYAEGESPNRIAQLLQVSQTDTVTPVLIEAGLVEMPKPRAAGGSSGEDVAERSTVKGKDQEVTRLESELDELANLMAEQRKDADDATKKLKAEHKKKIKELADERKALEAELQVATAITPQDEERHRKEAEAAVAEVERKFVPHFVTSIVQDLKSAKSDLAEAIEHGLDATQFGKIDAAHTAFVDELKVAAASVGEEITTA
jgi:hypothetical protein